jgi:protein HOOK3
MSESDIDDDTRKVGYQTESERMLVLQQKTNDKLRDLEFAYDEKSRLLVTALLDRDNLSPELLELKRAETIRQMRERIEDVIKAPAEAQPQILDTTSAEIAETVLSSEAALDKAKKVSTSQNSHTKSPSSAFDAAVSTMRRTRLDPSFSAATLIAPPSPESTRRGKNKSQSEMSASTVRTGQTTWGRMAHFLSPSRRKGSALGGTEYGTARTLDECVRVCPWPGCLSILIFATSHLSLYI